MAQIFISYEKSDLKIAEDIARGLESDGFTTWYYHRDNLPGPSYLEATGEAVDVCNAVLLIISPHSILSDQITPEIVRAHEMHKRFVPVLFDMTHEEFQARRKEWRQALGAATSITLPPEGAGPIIRKLCAGLRALGIQPDNAIASVPPSPASAPVPTPGVQPAPTTPAGPPCSSQAAAGPVHRIMLLYKRHAQPDETLLGLLEAQLTTQGFSVFIDRHLRAGTEWLLEIEKQVRSADAVIPLMSEASMMSEMLEWEVETAHRAAQEQNGKPYLVPVRIQFETPLREPLGAILDPIQYALWKGTQDNQKFLEEVLASLRNPPTPRVVRFEPAGGAVPLDSEFYILRPSDDEFRDAITRRDSIVLVKGARQMGKTSLLARGLRQARQAGAKVVLTDFQKLNEKDLQSVEQFYRALAELIAEKLDLDIDVASVWRSEQAANTNFERFLRREVLKKIGDPLVWGMDEVDRLFNCDFATDVFGLIRSWHNERSLDPEGPWKNLTMCIVYATEANLFIKDPNQSPFNVGTKLSLSDFNFKQVAELNARYGHPLRNESELNRFYEVVGGSPYLVRRGLQELKKPGMTLDAFLAEADRDEGPFGDHLRRILVILAKNPLLVESVKRVVNGVTEIPMDDFVRLRSAGVLAGESAREVRPRCKLYTAFLKRHLV
ncbi:MAG: AAA-like domain-containing protein [Candidatus Acidiferrales bacterium]